MNSKTTAKRKGYASKRLTTCGGCKHFYLHYIRRGPNDYFALDLGHCVHPALKDRRVDETCPHWEAAAVPDETLEQG